MASDDDRAGTKGATRSGLSGTIAVHEVMESADRRAREVVQSLGHRLASESTAEAIERRALSSDPPELLLVSMPECQELVDRIRKSPQPPIIMASLAGPPATARERFLGIDAEMYAVRPHSVENLGPLLQAAGVLADARRRIQALHSTEDRLRERLHQAGHSSKVTGFQHFEFFKKLLELEIRRAKRYEYGIAVCLVAPDPMDPPPRPDIQEKLSRKVAAAITSSIRDIDIPVDYADQRMLLFLPYTDVAGSKEVGERVLKLVRSAVHTKDGDSHIHMSVSIGIAATRDGQEVSFSKLMKDAGAALKAAQLKGGNRLICRD